MAILRICKQAKTMASPLFSSLSSRLLSSSYNQTPISEFTFRRSFSYIRRAAGHIDDAPRAGTLISVPRSVQSLKATRNFCCIAKRENPPPSRPPPGVGDSEAIYQGRLEFSENDLASDESLWKLYDRWCAFYYRSRTLAEKVERFDTFKECVHSVHKFNQEGHDTIWSLSPFSDVVQPGCPQIIKKIFRKPAVFHSSEEKMAFYRNVFGFPDPV